jgi:hypothetical protein
VPTNYRIEIELVVEDKDESAILDAARRQYLSGPQAWAEENGRRVLISAEDFIPGIESALLELVDANFQSTVRMWSPLHLGASRSRMIRRYGRPRITSGTNLGGKAARQNPVRFVLRVDVKRRKSRWSEPLMPSSGLCRVKSGNGSGAGISSVFARHNQSFFRKPSSGSSAWNRGAAWPAGASF